MFEKLKKTMVILIKSYSFLFKEAPVQASLLFIILILQGLTIPFGIWIGKKVVDLVFMSSQQNQPANIIYLIILWLVNSLISIAFSPLITLITGNLNEIFTAKVGLSIMQKANSFPDLTIFENIKFYDRVQLLNKQASYRPLNLLVTTVTLMRDICTLIGLFMLLAGLAWWLPLVIIICSWPQIQKSASLQERSWHTLISGQKDARAMDYFRSLVVNDAYSKEIRLFNLGGFFEKKYTNAFKKLHDLMKMDRKRLAIEPIPTIFLNLLGNMLIFGWVVSKAMVGTLKAGNIFTLLQSLSYLQQKMFDISSYAGLFRSHLSFFKEFFDFLDTKQTPLSFNSHTLAKLDRVQNIIFKNVSFNYPDGRVVLKNISFTINFGEKIAFVGENGAGKSTLIKLICRLYDPTEGQILVDGIDLRDLDLNYWRNNISAVFQDFGKYQLNVAENIALGNLDKLNEPEKIAKAARLANFDSVANCLPRQYETILGKEFGGTELSGGQWQKLAIARAFFKDSWLQILDEPTASLDPRAEHEIFEHFTQLADKKTVILVTHRLVSVQMVDKILVIKNGELVEQDSHQKLMALNGEYAALYRLQADKFAQKT